MICPECGENIKTLELRELCCSIIEVELNDRKEHLIEIGKPELTNANDEREYSCPNCHCLLFSDESDAVAFLREDGDKYTTKGWIKYMKNKMTEDYSELNAVKLALEKWELVRDGADIEIGTKTCALCYMFKNKCTECPIGTYTGQTGCNGTPLDGYDEDCDEDMDNIKQEMVLFLKRILKRVIVEDRLANGIE